MEHFANFGVVKAANKVKKKNSLLQKGEDLYSSNSSSAKRLLDEGYDFENILRGHQQVPNNAMAWSRANVELPQKSVKELPQYLASNSKGMMIGEARKTQRANQGLLSVKRKPKSGEYAEVRVNLPDYDAFTEVRKTDDIAASKTGYLGFRKDPFKGYGGMMEEPVDILRGGDKARIPY
jgi:hypothetical protein